MGRGPIVLACTAALALAACGTSDQQQAEQATRALATDVADGLARACHQKAKPRVVRVTCRPKPPYWACSFALANGFSGGVDVRLGHRSSWSGDRGWNCSGTG